MINGVSLSGLQMLNETHSSHYKNLNVIFNQKNTNFSKLDRSLVKVVRNKKLNHERWKQFQQNRYDLGMSRDNECKKEKIHQIMMTKSRYNFDFDDSMLTSRANNFYLRRKRQTSISHQNPQIAKRIINVHASLDHHKCHLEFRKTREIVNRLERFPVIQRLMKSSKKYSIKAKTEGDCMLPMMSLSREKHNAESTAKSKHKYDEFQN